MSNLAVRLYPEPIRTLAFGSISGTYAGIGTSFANASRLLIIQNFTEVTLTYSWDGVTDHLVLPTNGQIIIDVTANQTSTGGSLNFAIGTRIYVKGSPTTGAVYVTTFYGAS